MKIGQALGSAFTDWLELEIVRAVINAAWADEAVVGQLLEHVCGPAGSARDREDRREQVGRNAE